jgi:hypothetical protein
VKSKLKIAEAPDFKLAGEFKAINPPAVHHYDDIWPGLPVEEYEKKVTWGVPIEIAAGVDLSRLQISGALYAQACAMECIAPQDYKFVARLGAADPETAALTADTKDSAPGTSIQGSPKKPGVSRFQPTGSHVMLTGVLRPATTTPRSIAKLIMSRRSSYSPKRLACISNRRGPSGRPLRWPAV